MYRRVERCVAARVRDWVDAVAPGAILDVLYAPTGSADAVSTELLRIARARYPPIVRIRRGLYWKHDFGEPVRAPVPAYAAYLPAALHVAGAGAGVAAWGAASMFGWTRARVSGDEVAVVGSAPRGFDDRIVFRSRSNERRLALSRNGIALLEATLHFIIVGSDIEYRSGHSHWCDDDPSHDLDECTWDWPDALEAFTAYLNWTGPQRLDEHVLVAVAAKERVGGNELRSKIADLADCIRDAKTKAQSS